MQQSQPEQQQQHDHHTQPLTFEPLPQRIGANKNKRRRKVGGGLEEAAAADVEAAAQPAAGGDGSGSGSIAQAAAANGGVVNGTTSSHDNEEGQQQQQEHESADTMPAYRSAAVGQHKFEYLDHTADVQLHAWGSTLREAFEQVGLAMFNYMTPIDGLVVDDACTRQVTVTGHDLHSLLFNYLDELLFVYATEYIMMRELHIDVWCVPVDDADGNGSGSANGSAGEPKGAAAEAGAGAAAPEQQQQQQFSITVTGRGEKFDRTRHECGTEVKAITYSAMQVRQSQGDAEVFVIVDI